MKPPIWSNLAVYSSSLCEKNLMMFRKVRDHFRELDTGFLSL
jgi:hypothetical protein